MSDPTAITITSDLSDAQDPFIRRMSGYTNHGNRPFDVPFISHIHGNLYMGGCETGLVLPNTFKHLISLYKWEAYKVKHELDSSLTVKQYDSIEGADLARIWAVVRWASECVDDAPTLIHCQAGLNRSSLISALVLVRNSFVPDGKAAVALLREKRCDAVLCNPNI